MKVFIVGASGLVGSNTLSYLKMKKVDVAGSYFSYKTDDTVYFNTLDIDAKENFDLVAFNPDVIVHCGALTHVDYCETHEEESYEKTVQSTINLLKVAKKLNCKFVYISTDYVFDGESGPYSEDAKVNPLSVYGEHKLKAEQLVQESGLPNLIIRVAKVFGHEEREKNFVARLAKTIEETGELKWNGFTDQYTTAVNAKDIAKAIYLLLRDEKEGIYHLSYGEYFNAYEMVNIIGNSYYGITKQVKPITKADFKQDADRPAKGGLKNDKFLAEYPDFKFGTIPDYIAKRKGFKTL